MTTSWRRFRSHRGAIVGAIMVGVLVVTSLCAPWLTSRDPNLPDIDQGLSDMGAPLPPSHDSLLGTDTLGRDVWSRVIAGAGISLVIATLATAIALAIGVVVGVLAGYFGGQVDNLLMRSVDLVLALPFLLVAILLAALLYQAHLAASSAPVFVTLGVLGWTTTARVVRGKAGSLARSDLVCAAHALGASHARIIARHILPNLLGVLIVLTALGFAQNLLAEAVLSYVGLGPPPPMPTLGRMMFEGRAYYRTAPWLTIAPGAVIMLSVIAFNLLGEGVRDAIDVKVRSI